MFFNKKFWKDVASQTRRMFKRSPDTEEDSFAEMAQRIASFEGTAGEIIDTPFSKIFKEKDAPDRSKIQPGLKQGPGVEVLELRVWSEPDDACAHKYRKVLTTGEHKRSLGLTLKQEHEDFVCDLCTHQLCYTRSKHGKTTHLRPDVPRALKI